MVTHVSMAAGLPTGHFWQSILSTLLPDTSNHLSTCSPLDPTLHVEEDAAFKALLPHILLGPARLGQVSLSFLGPMVTRLGYPQGTELGPWHLTTARPRRWPCKSL